MNTPLMIIATAAGLLAGTALNSESPLFAIAFGTLAVVSAILALPKHV